MYLGKHPDRCHKLPAKSVEILFCICYNQLGIRNDLLIKKGTTMFVLLAGGLLIIIIAVIIAVISAVVSAVAAETDSED